MSNDHPPPEPAPGPTDATADADRRALVAYLADRDLACPVCAYRIRGLTSDVCPECGATLRLQVGAANLRLGPWLFALLAITLPLGLFSIPVLIMVIEWARGEFAPPLREIWPFFLGTATLATGLAVLVARRRRFWRQSWTRQRLFSIAIAVACGALAAGLIRYATTL